MLSSYKTKLIVKQKLTFDVFLFRFQLQEPTELYFIAGQYMILLVPQLGKEPLRRLYSIASSEKQTNSFELIIKLVDGGLGSEYLTDLQIGDFVDFQGPAGQFSLKENNNSKIFLATGTGIAPMLSMINSLVNPKSEIRNPKQIPNSKFQILNSLLWGLATFQDVFFLDRLKQLKATNPNFDFKICLSREKDLSMIDINDRQFFHLGRINSLLANNNSEFKILNSEFYICGRRETVEELRMQLEQLGVDRDKIYFEKF